VEWPHQLLELEQVQVAIRVGYYRPEGTNWAHELMLVVYTQPSEPRQAAPAGAKRRLPRGRFHF
jgi:hypothetical protein